MNETRVEKFKEYREEIQNSFSETDTTTKDKTSERVEKIIREQEGNNPLELNGDTTTISFDELMNSYDIYEKDDQEKYVSPLEPLLKKRNTYIITGFSICGLLIVGIIVVLALHLGAIL